jgi:DNA topoisomerase-2
LDDTTLEILELPIGSWTTKYKKTLEKLMAGENPFVQEYRDYNTDCRVKLEVVIPTLSTTSDADLEKKLALASSIPVSNLTLFSRDGTIAKYDSPEDILQDWYPIRLEYYEKRKVTLSKLRSEFPRQL